MLMYETELETVSTVAAGRPVCFKTGKSPRPAVWIRFVLAPRFSHWCLRNASVETLGRSPNLSKYGPRRSIIKRVGFYSFCRFQCYIWNLEWAFWRLHPVRRPLKREDRIFLELKEKKFLDKFGWKWGLVRKVVTINLKLHNYRC